MMDARGRNEKKSSPGNHIERKRLQEKRYTDAGKLITSAAVCFIEGGSDIRLVTNHL